MFSSDINQHLPLVMYLQDFTALSIVPPKQSFSHARKKNQSSALDQSRHGKLVNYTTGQFTMWPRKPTAGARERQHWVRNKHSDEKWFNSSTDEITAWLLSTQISSDAIQCPELQLNSTTTRHILGGRGKIKKKKKIGNNLQKI